jgi:hypothetical protein
MSNEGEAAGENPVQLHRFAIGINLFSGMARNFIGPVEVTHII